MGLPDSTTVITGVDQQPLTEPAAAVYSSLENPTAGKPLGEMIRPESRAVITHTDITRATPNHILIPAIVGYLRDAGISQQRITLLNSTGTHRIQTESELEEMLGKDVVRNCTCVQHNAADDGSLAPAGAVPGCPDLYLNRAYLEADLRIVTGFIEPHFFAGFSGGPKGILPGIADMKSILHNHRAENLENPLATWGVTKGNPLWDEMAAAARLAPPDFLVNVALNREGMITGIFTGELFGAHGAGCRYVADNAMVEVNGPFDLVVTSNCGYPLDQNLYQAVKGVSAAASITAPGGAIVIAAACSGGIPSHGNFGDLICRYTCCSAVSDFIHAGDETVMDQWQVQILSRLAEEYEIVVYSETLMKEDLPTSLFTVTGSIEETVGHFLARMGHGASIAVLPDGPQTIARVKMPS